MKICLIGAFGKGVRPDEGMAKVAGLMKEATESFAEEVFCIRPLGMMNPTSLLRIAADRPDIIQYISGPSVFSLILLRLAKLFSKGSRTVVFCTHSSIVGSSGLLRLLAPDIALTQAMNDHEVFNSLGSKTYTLINPVDITIFKPVGDSERRALRQEHGFAQDDFIVLHVGPVKTERNVGVMGRITNIPKVKPLIIASESVEADSVLVRSLSEKGVRIVSGFQEKIQEYYQIADCYLFPVNSKLASITTPLSVMEALAVNLPVVSTRFGALTEVFKDAPGIVFADSEEQFIDSIRNLLASEHNHTGRGMSRETIIPYSREKFRENLESIYKEVLRNAR